MEFFKSIVLLTLIITFIFSKLIIEIIKSFKLEEILRIVNI